MNKKIGIISMAVILFIYMFCTYSYSKYVFKESFVAFRIENIPVTENNSNNKSGKKNEQKSEVKPEEKMKEDNKANSGGWVDIVKIEHWCKGGKESFKKLT